jgi:hypothetical protein
LRIDRAAVVGVLKEEEEEEEEGQRDREMFLFSALRFYQPSREITTAHVILHTPLFLQEKAVHTGERKER